MDSESMTDETEVIENKDESESQTETAEHVVSDDKIECAICHARVHVIQDHLKREHPDMTVDEYRSQFPNAPLLSEKAKEFARKRLEADKAKRESEKETVIEGFEIARRAMHEIFELGKIKAALSHKGTPIPLSVFNAPENIAAFVPDIDPNYVYDVNLLKTVMLGLEARFNVYLWGHAGVGKSTIIEQCCARTGRPMLRVQHTRNTEESHVVGQWVVRDGETKFELGPLAFCMKYGLTYLADEYDFAMPAVTALYQPVLEGKPLVIKEADEKNRIIRPHPFFRFCATGNTNGTGDETGLYSGTLIMNAANYERFGIVEEVHYPEEKAEIGIVMAQGRIPAQEAKKMVDFARMIREAFTNGKIGLPISPRALINAANIGRLRGSLRVGLDSAYINRLSRVDQTAVREIADRISF